MIQKLKSYSGVLAAALAFTTPGFSQLPTEYFIAGGDTLELTNTIGSAVLGDSIYLQQGVYVVETTIVISEGIRLVGVEGAVLQSGPGLPAGDALLFLDATSSSLGSGLVIEGISFDGNAANVGIQGDCSGPFSLSPVIRNNRFVDIETAVHLKYDGSSATGSPLVEHNLMSGDDLIGTLPNKFGLYGLWLEVRNSASVTSTSRANTYRAMSVAVFDEAVNLGSLQSKHQSEIVHLSNAGYWATGGGAQTEVVHATVTRMFSDSSLGSNEACLHSDTLATITYMNSILWSLAGAGNHGVEIIQDPGSFIVAVGTNFVEDNMSVGPRYPDFVSPSSGDYRLKSTSPAIDSGDRFAVQPGAVYETAFDQSGGPRILDGDIHNGNPGGPSVIGHMIPDLGALEYSEVNVDIINYFAISLEPVGNNPGYMMSGYDPTGDAHVQFYDGDYCELKLDGPAGADYMISFRLLGPTTNVLVPDFGNLLVNPSATVSFNGTLTGSSGGSTASVTIPLTSQVLPVSFADYEVQCLVVPDPLVPTEGNFSRRIQIDRIN